MLLEQWENSSPGMSASICRRTTLILFHKIVDHVHFHVIPKPSASDKEGLVIGWPQQEMSKEELATVFEEIKGRL